MSSRSRFLSAHASAFDYAFIRLIAITTMQVTIMSRFGIKSHAVQDRDYMFANGDPTDLRYSNIELINPYHGVKRNMEKGQVSFSVYLNINGTWKTGTFNTVTEAAIAYNKAA